MLKKTTVSISVHEANVAINTNPTGFGRNYLGVDDCDEVVIEGTGKDGTKIRLIRTLRDVGVGDCLMECKEIAEKIMARATELDFELVVIAKKS